jgi:hypothetical protein
VEVTDDRDELVIAGLSAAHAERGGEGVDIEGAESLVQEQGSEACAGAAVQLDQRKGESEGREEGSTARPAAPETGSQPQRRQ